MNLKNLYINILKMILKSNMKSITEFLSTKVKIDKDTLYRGFPKTPNIDLIIKFLKENNFVQIERDSEFSTASGQIMNGVDRQTKNVFVCINLNSIGTVFGTAIYFCKTGEINRKNPLFYVRINEKDGNCSFIRKTPDKHEFEDINEFKKEIDDCYGF